jgi:hypothetical protein
VRRRNRCAARNPGGSDSGFPQHSTAGPHLFSKTLIDMTDGVARIAAMIAALMLIKPIRSCGATKKCW